MTKLRAVILHKHVLFRELIESELRDVTPVIIAGATSDAPTALDLLRETASTALVVESAEGFIGRREMLRIFCDAAETVPQFVLIAANLSTSEIEVLQDRVSRTHHLGALNALLQEVAS